MGLLEVCLAWRYSLPKTLAANESFHCQQFIYFPSLNWLYTGSKWKRSHQCNTFSLINISSLKTNLDFRVRFFRGPVWTVWYLPKTDRDRKLLRWICFIIYSNLNVQKVNVCVTWIRFLVYASPKRTTSSSSSSNNYYYYHYNHHHQVCLCSYINEVKNWNKEVKGGKI